MKTYIYLWSCLTYSFLEWELLQTKTVEKIKTHVLRSITFFRKSRYLWDNAEKFGTAGEGTDDNMAHVHCMLDTQGYKHTLRISNIIAFLRQQ